MSQIYFDYTQKELRDLRDDILKELIKNRSCNYLVTRPILASLKEEADWLAGKLYREPFTKKED